VCLPQPLTTQDWEPVIIPQEAGLWSSMKDEQAVNAGSHIYH
jgi:hypothetical protein